MLTSRFFPLIPVVLPTPEKGRQFYMHGFDAAKPHMPEGFEDYLDPVSKLLAAAGVIGGRIFLTVDEKIVKAGMSQRRPGPHVDGCFMPEHKDWRHGQGGWNHICNNVPFARMPVIVAASVGGARAWYGHYDGVPKEDGDCAELVKDSEAFSYLSQNWGWLLSPDCIHESPIYDVDTPRTFIRLALPVDGDAARQFTKH